MESKNTCNSPALHYYRADGTKKTFSYKYVNTNTSYQCCCGLFGECIVRYVVWTYRELKEMTCQIANLMIEAGLKYENGKSKPAADDKSTTSDIAGTDVPKMVMICMPLNPLAVASMLACSRIGAVH